MTPGKTNPTEGVVKALVWLAEAMRVEGLARLTYVGDAFEVEAADKVEAVKLARESFEGALKSYVGKLVRA